MGNTVGEMDILGMQMIHDADDLSFSTTFISTSCYFLQYCYLAHFCLKEMPFISYIQRYAVEGA